MKKKRINAMPRCRNLRRRVLIFRNFLMLCSFVFFALPMEGSAQQKTKVTVELRNVSLDEVISELRKQTDYDFFYNTELAKSKKNVNVAARDKQVTELLNEILPPLGMEYAVQGDMISIRAKEQKQMQTTESKEVSGKVIDAQGNVLPGVTVLVKGTTLGTSTDADGKYNLTLPVMNQNLVLVFSFIGMESQEVVYTGQSNINITLIASATEMDEVVITGIYTRKKESFTGSSQTYRDEELKMVGNANVLESLKTLDPSFAIIENNEFGSDPNHLPDIEIRGKTSVVGLTDEYETDPNQPLFILDGFETTLQTISDLSMDRVQSITVLKDAAATAIYGSKAANGVVVVETKAPKPGKLRFTYNGNYGLEWPDLSVYDLMNAKEKLRIEELAGYYDNKDDVGLQYYYNNLKQEVLRGVDTYWLGEPVRTAFSHRHGLTIEGGDNVLRYKLYLGANWDPGVMKETNLNTKTGKIDLNYRQNKLLINNSLSIDYSDGTRESPYGSFQDYATVNPYYRKTDENGNIKQVLDSGEVETDYTGGGQVANYYSPILNPLWNKQFDSKNQSTSFEIREALRVEYLPIEPLRLSLDFSLMRTDATVEVFKSAQHTDFYEETDPAKKGAYTNTETKTSNYRLGLSASYNKVFGDHLISAYVNYSIRENSSNSSTLTMTGFPNDKLSEVYMGTEYSSTSGSESVARSLAFVMTLNYAYKQKYAVDYSLSINGSSEFGKNNRFAPFWSAGLRWNAEREEFIKSLGIFDELVLRGTYGITGSQGFTPYQSLQMYTYQNLMKTYKSFDVVGTEIYGLGNPDLKWQQTQNYNVSLDFTMFHNILSAKFEYYEKYTKNTLLDYTMAPSVGFSTMKENLGKISNKGYEVTLRLMPYSDPAKQAYWNIIFTGAHNKSRIEEISNALKVMNEKQMALADEEENSYFSDVDNKREKKPLPRYENGYSQTTIWAVRSMGIDPQTGREVFMTRDGQLTNEYSSADQVPVGDTEPKFQGSVSTTFTYKGLSLTLAGQYHWGGQTYNSTLINKVENANLRKNVDRRALYSRWQKPGDRVFFKAIDGNVYKTDTKESSRFVMDDNEFYFSTINLSYRVDGKKHNWMKYAGITSATLGLYMEDICRLSTVKMERGIDYPFSRSVSMSLSVVF